MTSVTKIRITLPSTFKQILVAFYCFTGLSAMITPASAEIVYSDSFGGDTANMLIGSTPDISSSIFGGSASAVWNANDGGAVFRADGTVNGNKGFVFSAYLPFTPQTGVIYTFSADVNTLGGTNGDWISLAFLDNSATYNMVTSADTRMLLRDADNRGPGGGQTWTGETLSTPFIDFYSDTGVVNLQIVLNTTGQRWTEQFFQNNTTVYGPYTYISNPNIAYIGFQELLSATGTIDNFSLTATSSVTSVPEPSTLALGCLGLALRARRHRRAASGCHC